MLTDHEVDVLLTEIGLPEGGRRLVKQARIEAPVRQVRSTGRNVITVLASRKMCREIETESRKVEYAAAVDHEANLAVLEYYAQPCLLKLELIDDETGEVKLVDHTPDFLVVTKEEVILEEWKTEASLLHLARKFPWRYIKEAGSWRSPQIEEAMARIGIVYKVRSNAEIHPNKTKNLEILEDYMHVDVRPCHEHIVDRLKAALAEHGRLSLGDLHGPPFNFSPDVLNQAIVYVTCPGISYQ